MPTLNRKILLLDDDIDIQELLIERLGARGFQVLPFTDPTEVLKRIREEPDYFDQFDLVLTDYRMPKMDGLEFIEQAKELSKKIPIILMTATNKVDLAVRAIKAGAYDFVVKPINFTQLNVSVDRALDFTRLKTENDMLRSSLNKSTMGFGEIVGKSRAIQTVFDLARRVAGSSANVLISGESGTGKEVIARTIHQQSSRSKKSFVAINCSAIPEALLESELFGHAKGAFTGAIDKKMGLFEEAHGGTLFLDEIGDLNLPLQAKLLRVIQERMIKRVGENMEREIDVRVLAATHKDLKKEVGEGRFREDLFFRLNVIPIHIPALRERRDDIIPLAEHFFKKFTGQNNSELKGFSKAALEHIFNLRWPGNVRELENAVERAVILAPGPMIEANDLPVYEWTQSTQTSRNAEVKKSGPLTVSDILESPAGRLPTLEEFTRDYVALVLERTGGVKEQAARILNIDRKTLYRKIADHSKEKSGESLQEKSGTMPTPMMSGADA